MDIDTAKLFVEQHPGHITLIDTETRILSASKTVITDLGYKSSDLVIGVSYYDVPVKAKKLAQHFHQSDKELISGVPCINNLVFWSLNNDKQMLTLAEKFPIKDKNNHVIAILVHWMDITHSNLIDISKYLKLFNHDKYVLGNDNQFCYKIHKSNNYNYHQENLSAREIECLFYILRGKSAKDVGKILHLSYRTIEDHIASIKYKLNVTRKAQLIEKAINQGYMNVLPQSFLAKHT